MQRSAIVRCADFLSEIFQFQFSRIFTFPCIASNWNIFFLNQNADAYMLISEMTVPFQHRIWCALKYSVNCCCMKRNRWSLGVADENLWVLWLLLVLGKYQFFNSVAMEYWDSCRMVHRIWYAIEHYSIGWWQCTRLFCSSVYTAFHKNWPLHLISP